jgi:hypothetical protein
MILLYDQLFYYQEEIYMPLTTFYDTTCDTFNTYGFYPFQTQNVVFAEPKKTSFFELHKAT